MNSYFERLELEMIALESAIGAFEAENDITDEYLHDYSEPCYANESAYSDDFGFGLFGDMTPACEEADGNGSKLSNGIKHILSAIGKFFSNLGEGMKSFFQAFKSKKAEVKKEDVNVSPQAQQVATNLRGAIKNAITIISNVTKSDTEFMKKICSDIKDSINKVGTSKLQQAEKGGKGLGSAVRDALNTTDRYRDEAYAEVGRNFVSKSGGNDTAENKSIADERVAKAKSILDKVEKSESDLKQALQKIQEIYKSEMMKAARAYNDRNAEKAKKYGESNYSYESRKADMDEEDKKQLKAQNNAEAKRKSVGVQQALATVNMRETAINNQVRQAIFVDYKIEDIAKLCDGVTTACGDLEGFCTSVAEKDFSGSDYYSKIAYELCKILSRASTVYTKIAGAIRQLTNGTIFNSSGDVKVETRERTSASKDEQDYLDE